MPLLLCVSGCMLWLLFAPAAANHLDIIIILLTTATIFIATHVHCRFYFRRLVHGGRNCRGQRRNEESALDADGDKDGVNK